MTTKHTDEKQPATATTPLPPRPGEIQSINEPPPPRPDLPPQPEVDPEEVKKEPPKHERHEDEHAKRHR